LPGLGLFGGISPTAAVLEKKREDEKNMMMMACMMCVANRG